MTTKSGNNSSPFSEIERRCKEARIEIEPSKIEESTDSLVVLLPTGRSKRKISVVDNESAEALLSIPFEKICGINGYRAF